MGEIETKTESGLEWFHLSIKCFGDFVLKAATEDDAWEMLRNYLSARPYYGIDTDVLPHLKEARELTDEEKNVRNIVMNGEVHLAGITEYLPMTILPDISKVAVRHEIDQLEFELIGF